MSHGSGWPVIDGIDGAAAAERFGADTALFLSLLQRLLAEFGDLAASLSAPPARERIHRLRGSAGLLGAVRVQHAAAAADATLRRGADAGSELTALSAALQSLQQAVARHAAMQAEGGHATAQAVAGRVAAQAEAGHTTAQAEAGRVAAQAVAGHATAQTEAGNVATQSVAGHAAVQSLRRALMRRDAAALGLLAADAAALRSALGDAAFSRLQASVDALDFAAALAALQPVAPGR